MPGLPLCCVCVLERKTLKNRVSVSRPNVNGPHDRKLLNKLNDAYFKYKNAERFV